MFALNRIIGVVNAGSLQPTQLQVVGDWVCPGGANSDIQLELQITAPIGAPSGTFTETTNNGTNGPAGSVTFLVSAWPGLTSAPSSRAKCGLLQRHVDRVGSGRFHGDRSSGVLASSSMLQSWGHAAAIHPRKP